MPRRKLTDPERALGITNWRFESLSRERLLREPFGLDSVQGYLELATWYGKGRVVFGCHTSDRDVFDSMYHRLLQLEAEGYLLLEWSARDDDPEHVSLEQIALTIAGHKLLTELQLKSKWGKLKDRLIGILWAAATSVVTTLAVIGFKK